MPPDSAQMLLGGAVAQQGELEQLLDSLRHHLGGEAEVAGMDDEVLADRQLAVEVGLLGHDPERRLDPPPLAGGIEAQDPELAPSDRDQAVDHLHRGRLPGAVRPQEAEADPGRDVEVDPVHGHALAVALARAAGRPRPVPGLRRSVTRSGR